MLHDRAMLATVGICLTVVGLSLSPPYLYATLADRVPWLWEAAFVAAGLSTAGWAARPDSHLLYLTSGLALLAAAISRGAALIVLAGQPTGAAWLALAALTVRLWPRLRDDMGATWDG